MPAPAGPLQGGEVEVLQRQVAQLQQHVAQQVAAVDAATAERDAYKLSAHEIQERSKVGVVARLWHACSEMCACGQQGPRGARRVPLPRILTRPCTTPTQAGPGGGGGGA